MFYSTIWFIPVCILMFWGKPLSVDNVSTVSSQVYALLFLFLFEYDFTIFDILAFDSAFAVAPEAAYSFGIIEWSKKWTYEGITVHMWVPFQFKNYKYELWHELGYENYSFNPNYELANMLSKWDDELSNYRFTKMIRKKVYKHSFYYNKQSYIFLIPYKQKYHFDVGFSINNIMNIYFKEGILKVIFVEICYWLFLTAVQIVIYLIPCLFFGFTVSVLGKLFFFIFYSFYFTLNDHYNYLYAKRQVSFKSKIHYFLKKWFV